MLQPEGSGWKPRLERVFEALLPEGPRPPPAALDPLCAWLDLAVRWNQRIDLTAARDPDSLVDLMVADAAVIWGSEPPASGECWVDVGSGIGAPGLPIALFSPGVEMTLVEPRTKRAAFLRSVVGELGRSDITVERRRSDALAEGFADVAVSRATLPPQQWLAEGNRLATKSCWVLLAGGPAPQAPGSALDREVSYRWPLGGGERRALRFRRQVGP
jgi:16S rRNA (guanine527-N7)-methyltransferase